VQKVFLPSMKKHDIQTFMYLIAHRLGDK